MKTLTPQQLSRAESRTSTGRVHECAREKRLSRSLAGAERRVGRAHSPVSMHTSPVRAGDGRRSDDRRRLGATAGSPNRRQANSDVSRLTKLPIGFTHRFGSSGPVRAAQLDALVVAVIALREAPQPADPLDFAAPQKPVQTISNGAG